MASILKTNVIDSNPVLMQVLGICSTLAVTGLMMNSFIMTVGVAIVTAFSSLVISIIKDFIPRKVRMIVQVIVIAFFTIIIDLLLKAYIPDVSKALGPYVGLIITNCIIMGRAEAFAQSNPPLASMWDGFTSGLGYMSVLLIIAFFRELLGSGTLFGFPVLPQEFLTTGSNFNIMVLSPIAFFFIAIVIWVLKAFFIKEAAAPAKK